MGFKMKHGNAAGLMMSSPLYSSPLNETVGEGENPYADHAYSVGGESGTDAVNAKNYQNKLRKKMAENPDGYFEVYSPYHGRTQIYDKTLYGQDKKGNLTFHEKTHTRDKEGNIVPKQLNVPKPKTTEVKKPTDPNNKIDLKKYKGGGLQTQDGWGDMKNITLGHGEKSNANKVSDIIGVPSSLKGDYTEVETRTNSANDLVTPDMKKTFTETNKMLEEDKKKIKENKPTTTTDASTTKTDSKPKTSYSEAYKNRDMDTYGGLNEEDYTKEAKRQNEVYKKTGKWDTPKGPMTSEKPELEKMEKREAQPISITPTAPRSKMETTVTNAMDPNHKLVESGRIGRVRRRQEKRTQKIVDRERRRRGETTGAGESVQQERKNLLADMPVDRDATGGRYKNDKATKKLVKETSKQAKKDNAMKDAKAAVEAGDKKALRKSGVEGKYKRAGRQDIKGAKKAGAMDAAKAAVEAGDKKALRKSGAEGKYKRAGRQDIAATEKQKKKTAKKITKSKLPKQESPKQERKNLLTDMPVDKDATGGRSSSFDANSAGGFDYSQTKRQNKNRYKS